MADKVWDITVKLGVSGSRDGNLEKEAIHGMELRDKQALFAKESTKKTS